MIEYQRRTIVLQGGSLPKLEKEGRWCIMSTYEVLTLLTLFGTFLVALLTYIDRNNKQGSNIHASMATWLVARGNKQAYLVTWPYR